MEENKNEKPINEKKLIYLDVETTGLEDEDRLCEVAYSIDNVMTEKKFKPPVPIKVGAMAVSHITNKMVEDCETFVGSEEFDTLKRLADSGEYIFVAHNAPFDLRMMEKEGITFTDFIDTKKLSHKLDKDDSMESHRLQYLRYYYGVEMPEMIAHSAEGDVAVLKAVHERLVEELGRPTLEEQMEISKRPILFSKIKFGKYKGNDLADVAVTNPQYLEWLLSEKRKSGETQDETDWIYTLEHYLNNVA